MPDNRSFQGNRDRGAYNDRPKPQALPPVEFEFYKDGNKNPKDDLFSTTAQNIAKTFYISGDNCVTKTQLRRQFDEVKRFEQILEISENQWEAQKPYIKMIESKVSYAAGRAIGNTPKLENVYKNLKFFVTCGLKKIDDIKDFKVFVSLFEAVVGFYYEINQKKD